MARGGELSLLRSMLTGSARKKVVEVTSLLLLMLLAFPSCCHGFLQLHHGFLRNSNQLFKRPLLLQADSPLWITQPLDHFNPQDNRTFQQRYYELVDYVVDPRGPIFLEICGEARCGGIGDSFYLELAKELNAAYVTLEHRYYGASIPTLDFSTKSLAYLTTGQALFDLANFRNYYQAQINQRHNLSQNFENAWIVLGCSYAGALSAWFRLKFPHLVRGSISSSGVVNSIENYQAYDLQVGESLGPQCGAVFKNLTRIIEVGLKRNATYIKSLFNATNLIDGDFAFMLGSFAVFVQYGNPDSVCRPMLDAINNGTNVLEAYVDFLTNWGLTNETNGFNYKNLIDTSRNNSGRLWFYQRCSELGFFVTAASKNNIFIHALNQKYYLDVCAKVFGNGTEPNTKFTNLNYGATRISGSRILFMNGSQDPWRHASKKISTPNEKSVLITCSNCAHCVDTIGCQSYQPSGDPTYNPRYCSSPENVTQARDIMRSSIKEWIQSKY